MRNVPVLLIALLANLLIHLYCGFELINSAGNKKNNESPGQTMTTISPDYEFLLFPTEQAAVFKTEKFLTAERIGPLKRAISATHQEINDGAIGLADGGFVPSSTLSYLPDGDSNSYLKSWLEKRTALDPDFGGSWTTLDLSNGHKLVRLKIVDNKHCRSYNYAYETNGKELFKVQPCQLESGVADGMIALLIFSFLVFSALILGFWRFALGAQSMKSRSQSVSKG